MRIVRAWSEHSIYLLRIHRVRREHHAVRSDKNDRTALNDLRIGRQATENFCAAYLHVGGGLRPEENIDGVIFDKVLSIDSQHLRCMRIGLG
jgi:hypothetical protein